MVRLENTTESNTKILNKKPDDNAPVFFTDYDTSLILNKACNDTIISPNFELYAIKKSTLEYFLIKKVKILTILLSKLIQQKTGMEGESIPKLKQENIRIFHIQREKSERAANFKERMNKQPLNVIFILEYL